MMEWIGGSLERFEALEVREANVNLSVFPWHKELQRIYRVPDHAKHRQFPFSPIAI